MHLEVSRVSRQDRPASRFHYRVFCSPKGFLRSQLPVNGEWLLENACLGKICIKIPVKWDPFIHPPKPWSLIFFPWSRCPEPLHPACILFRNCLGGGLRNDLAFPLPPPTGVVPSPVEILTPHTTAKTQAGQCDHGDHQKSKWEGP